MTTGWILDARPLHCRYGEQMYYGLLHAVQYAQSKGYNICDLAGSDAVKEKIYEKLDELNPIFFFGMGHGNIDKFTDDKEWAVWWCGEKSCSLPPDNLRGRIVYLWSCLTARQLGPKIIEHGGWSYAGFKEEWVWVPDRLGGDPYDDKYAKGFFESGNELIIALLDKKTMQEAVQASLDKYNEWIDYWKQSDDPGASECIKWLAWDRDALTLLGDPFASLMQLKIEQGAEFYTDVYLYNPNEELEMDMIVAFGTYNKDTNVFTTVWKYVSQGVSIPHDMSTIRFTCTAEQKGTWDIYAAIGKYDQSTDSFTATDFLIEEDVLIVTD